MAAEATLLTSLAKFHRFPLRESRPETEVADADQYCPLVDWRSRPPLTACAALIANEKAPALWENRGLDGEIAGSWGLKVTLRPVIRRASKSLSSRGPPSRTGWLIIERNRRPPTDVRNEEPGFSSFARAPLATQAPAASKPGAFFAPPPWSARSSSRSPM